MSHFQAVDIVGFEQRSLFANMWLWFPLIHQQRVSNINTGRGQHLMEVDRDHGFYQNTINGCYVLPISLGGSNRLSGAVTDTNAALL